jgi:hypothetical protein
LQIVAPLLRVGWPLGAPARALAIANARPTAVADSRSSAVTWSITKTWQ